MEREWIWRRDRRNRLWQSWAKRFSSKRGSAQAYLLAALVLVILLIAAVDRAAENCKAVFPMEAGGSRTANKASLNDLSPAPKTNDESRPLPTIAPTTELEHAGKGPEPSSTKDFGTEAWSYFHPSWEKDLSPSLETLDPIPSPRSPPTSLVRLLDDPENRVEKEFHVPREMRDRVFFWMQIHSRFDTAMRVIHDRNHPRRVYGYADFTKIYESAGSRAVADAHAYRLEREVVRQLKARLAEAAGLTTTHLLTPWEKATLQQLLSSAGAMSPDGAQRLMNAIRSQTGQRDEFLAALKRSEDLLPYIEMTFRLQGLPAALGHIPFVESSFNWRAHSKVGAMGIWQFMPETARQMIGGDPNRWSDPLRQTRGAARLFKIFREMLPDWSTSITSYNSGAGRLKHLVQKYRTKSIVKLLDVSDGESLGFAGKNFYAQFLSVNLMEAYKLEVFPELRRERAEDLLAFHYVQPFSREFRSEYY